MTIKIIAKNHDDARAVARALRLLEWRLLNAATVLRVAPGEAVIVTDLAKESADYGSACAAVRRRGGMLYPLAEWVDRFQIVALYTRGALDGEHEEKEVIVRDDAEAQSMHNKDGWLLVWFGTAAEAREDNEMPY